MAYFDKNNISTIVYHLIGMKERIEKEKDYLISEIPNSSQVTWAELDCEALEVTIKILEDKIGEQYGV